MDRTIAQPRHVDCNLDLVLTTATFCTRAHSISIPFPTIDSLEQLSTF
jgi:hypothetical protein